MSAAESSAAAESAFYESLRLLMVDSQLRPRGITDAEVLRAMSIVPRHEFVAPADRGVAYDDHPVVIACSQSVSQPYIVGLMTQSLGVSRDARVLEVGTGAGYQAAVLAEMGVRVHTIELERTLADQAVRTLGRLGYLDRVTVHCGDGWAGWPPEAPFDGILVAAAPRQVPAPLVAQLRPGARLVVPVGDQNQELLVIEKTAGGLLQRTAGPVRFVPMRGEAQGRN